MLSEREDKLLHSKQPIFHKWYLGDIIGEGSSGTVYEITDNNGNYSALKVIPVTIDDRTNTIHLKEQDIASQQKYLNEMTNEILAEVRVMQKLRHNAGIVTYQEYDVIKTTDLFVHLILIKMDLLQSLNKVLRMRESEFTQKEVVTMGIDLLTALSECRKHNIIHRDIKPSNIFVTKDNKYLLGDFGNARLLEKTMMASHKGTLCYMAPEVAAGQTFNATIDIYSLGIMMYQLLNNRRLPFLNDSFKFSDIESAVEKRLSGVLLPYPENADNELGKIICKMCAYSPKERYTSAEECLEDLKHYMMYGKPMQKPHRKIKVLIISVFLLIILLLAVLALSMVLGTKSNPSIGISSGNVNSSGVVTSDKEWLYYSQDVTGERGIRVSKDGKQKEVLCNHIMHDINITEDYIFFSSKYITINPGLYRMDKDGSNLICLDDSSISNPVTYGEYVYYLKNDENNKILCKVPIQGGEIETISKFDLNTNYFYPYEKQLYIYDNQAEQLISLDIYDGTKTVIVNEAIQRFCIEDGLLYFLPVGTDADYNNKIYIYEINPSSPTTINIKDKNINVIAFPYGIYEFNVSNGVIYASSNTNAFHENQSDKDGIWRVNNDGSDLKQIYTGHAIELQVTDQKLCFMDTLLVYYMDLNGDNINKLEDMTLFYMSE